MIRHIVMWKLKEENKAENARKIKEDLESLSGKIPGLIAAQVGIDVKTEEDSYDAVLIADFESLQALEAYRVHPAHVRVSEFVKSVRCDRKTVDFESSER